MKCTQCGDFKTTVGELRACPRCTQPQDGTAAMIPAEIADSAPIQDAIAVKPGLANRFLTGDSPETAAAEHAANVAASETNAI